jgi:hypothetical protein
MTTLVMLINLALVSWASQQWTLHNGLWELYEGNCDSTDRWNLGLHVLINVCSTLLLSASNYTMQCLISPTRAECDVAHARGDWLEIGIPNVRNLSKISWRRSAVWFFVACSSIPIHLLYNSVVFKTLDANIYSTVLANSRFLEVSTIVMPNDSISARGEVSLEEVRSMAHALQEKWHEDPSSFDKLSIPECLSIYGVPWVSGYSHVVYITSDVNDTERRLDVNTYQAKYVHPLDENANSW